MPKLSDAFIRSSTAGMYWDEALQGFGLRAGKRAKTFIVLIGSGKRRKIGRYPYISLADARKCAQETIAEHTLGLRQVGGCTMTFEQAVPMFLAASAAKNRTKTTEDYSHRLRRAWLPLFSKRLLNDIKRREISLAMAHRSPSENQHNLIVLKIFYSWAFKAGYVETDPTYRMPSLMRYTPRERILDREEVKTVYRVLSNDPDTYKRIVMLLLLTGQRRNEIARLEWGWINDGTITIPAHISKNRRAHTFPIGNMVSKIIADTPQISRYVFPAAREHVRNIPTSCFNGWPKAKRQLDQQLQFTSHWTLHDLRRTYSSTLAEIGIRLEVTEKILNHISGSISGVAAVYNRYRYQPEMKEAVDRYEQHMCKLLAL